MYKNILTIVGITILFLSMSIVPSVAIDNVNKSSIPISDKNIIVVDNEGDGDYTSIQDAIVNATAGNIIEVYSGIYHEEDIIITTENITLRGIPYELGTGNDFGKPVIKDITDIVTLIIFNNSGITVDGFELEGNESHFLYNIVSFVIGDNNVLSNCDIIKGNDLGSCVLVCNKIKNTKIINNNLSAMGTGIVLAGINNFVIGNRINNMKSKGIVCNNKYCNVSGNLISECDWGIEIGCNNTIRNNIISECNIGIALYEKLENEMKLHLEKRNLYLRFDKQSAFKGELRLTHYDPIHFKIHFKNKGFEEILTLCRDAGMLP